MSDDEKSRPNAEIEREIRLGRKFNAKEALARMAGPGALKGASPVSPVHQAEAEIASWLGSNLEDVDGALRVVLQRRLKDSAPLLANLDRPLVAVAEYLAHALAADSHLRELVGEADVEWGRAMGERPHFEREGLPPHADDPYTAEGVRKTLSDALARLTEDSG